MVAAPFELVDNLDLDCTFRTGINASGFEAGGETAVAHIALAYNATLRIELRHRIRAVPNTVLATDAGIGGVHYDTRNRVLLVGIYGASPQAFCREAMVTSHRQIVAYSLRPGASLDLSDAAPAQIGRVAVLFIACDLAGAAADALGHVEVEAILFSGIKRPSGDERRLYLRASRWLRKYLQTAFRQAHDRIR